VFSYRVKRDEVIQKVLAVIPAALMADPPTRGPGALGVATEGRSALEEWLDHDPLPKRIAVTASGSGWGG